MLLNSATQLSRKRATLAHTTASALFAAAWKSAPCPACLTWQAALPR